MASKDKPKDSASKTSLRPKVQKRDNVVTPDNDNLSKALKDIVPKEFQGTNRYLDVIQWNLEWFGARKSQDKDKKRVNLVLGILQALNGDLFVFQEAAGPSEDGRYPGALDDIAEDLTRRGAGDYVVYYTKAGGEQRVAMMWDREWLRAKVEPYDLFKVGKHKTPDGKDAFAQRTPLYSYFTARVPVDVETKDPRYGGGADKFDFQVLGVHLKAMKEGYPQRLESAKVLANWMVEEAPKIDADVLIMGDWNAPPDDPSWKPLQDLDKMSLGADAKIGFRDINDPSDFSYLWLENKTDKNVSRIDLQAMSLSSMKEVEGKAAQVVRWKPIQKVLAHAASITDKEVREVMLQMKNSISDHMPVVSRFYFTEGEET